MDNKPICITDINGNKKWFIDGEYHREDGPAIEEKNGTKQWYINGVLHRLDGPAYIDNWNTISWFINGYEITEKIFKWAKENDIDLDNLSDVDKALIKIVWTDYKIT